MAKNMSREKFMKLWSEAGLDRFVDNLLDKGTMYTTDNFYFIYDVDTEQVLFIDRYSVSSNEPAMFGWYKLMHVGRSLICNMNTKVLETELEMLYDDLSKLYGESNNE